jgi:hypothetical protein
MILSIKPGQENKRPRMQDVSNRPWRTVFFIGSGRPDRSNLGETTGSLGQKLPNGAVS